MTRIFAPTDIDHRLARRCHRRVAWRVARGSKGRHRARRRQRQSRKHRNVRNLYLCRRHHRGEMLARSKSIWAGRRARARQKKENRRSQYPARCAEQARA